MNVYIYTESHKIRSTQSICVHPGAQNSEDKEALCSARSLSLARCLNVPILLCRAKAGGRGWNPSLARYLQSFIDWPATLLIILARMWGVLSVNILGNFKCVCVQAHTPHSRIRGSWEQSLDASVGRISTAVDVIGFSLTKSNCVRRWN